MSSIHGVGLCITAMRKLLSKATAFFRVEVGSLLADEA
jgi:hypothetical protein